MRFKKTLLNAALLCLLATQSEAGSLFGSDTLSRPSRTFDALHYKIEVRFEPEQKKVLGTTTISLIPLRGKLDSIVLHAVELDVRSVSLPGKQPLRFSNNQKELTVVFNRTYGFRDTLSVCVEYTATPKQGMYFLAPDSIDPKRHHQIWTQGEDMNNRYWFPCWDFPNDKATSEVIATVPDSWTLLSNGKLLEMKQDKKKMAKTFHWYQSKPHASYLVMIAAGEYDVISEKTNGIPLEYYVYKEKRDDGKRSFAPTPDIMKFFVDTIGYPYPWEKFSQIFIDDFMWGGMENTSAVTYNTSYLIDQRGMLDFTSTDVIAHELVHQWFGDLVTARDWTELWLNEGFANYYEALYKKSSRGYDEFLLDMKNQSDGVLSLERAQGRKPVVSQDSYTTNLYSKGAWVLCMLHNLLGDQEFHRAVELYLRRHAFTSVSTHDFAKAVEDATGQNMDWFFHQWLYKAGHPQLQVESFWNDTAKQLSLTIRQTQTLDSLTGVFILPLDIECTTSVGRTLKRVYLTKQEELIAIPLPEKPLMILVDKGRKVLKTVKHEKSKDEYIYQLLHAENGVDRMAAAKPLKEFPDDGSVFDALKHAALNDSFWAVRREATIYLGTMKHPAVKQAMFAIYNDKKSSVRNAAVVALEKFPSRDVSDFLQAALVSDSSYLVQSSCLQSLDDVDSSAALTFALKLADQDSYRDIIRRSALHVLRSHRSPAALDVARRYATLGNPPDIRATSLGILREAGEKDPVSRSFMCKLTSDVNSTIRKGAIQTLGMWGGEDVIAILEERKATESDSEVREAIQSALEEISQK